MTVRTIADKIFESEKIRRLSSMAADYGQTHAGNRRAIDKVLLEPRMGKWVVSVAGVGPIMSYACALATQQDTPFQIVDKINTELGAKVMGRREAGLLAAKIAAFADEYDPSEMEEMGLVGTMALNKSDMGDVKTPVKMNGIYVVRERMPLCFDLTQKTGSDVPVEFEMEISPAGIKNARGVSSIYKLKLRTKIDGKESLLEEWRRGLAEARDYTFGRTPTIEGDGVHEIPEGYVALEAGLPEGLHGAVLERQFRGLIRNGVLVVGVLGENAGIFDKPCPNPDTYWLY